MKPTIFIIVFFAALMNVACSTIDLVSFAAVVLLEDKVIDAFKNNKLEEDKVTEEVKKQKLNK